MIDAVDDDKTDDDNGDKVDYGDDMSKERGGVILDSVDCDESMM